MNKNIYGHFAEHLGRGIYEGIWVGPSSPIPNTRGIRNDVVAALKDVKVAVRGKVVKFLPAIMGKNWIHLRDGSGSTAAGDFDLTVTELHPQPALQHEKQFVLHLV